MATATLADDTAADGDERGFIEQALVADALPGELDGFDAAARQAAVALAEAAWRGRAPARPSVEADTAAGGESGRIMRLAVVNDDMPFLVDSLAATITGFGLTIERLLHPVLSDGERSYSLIYTEVERPDAKDRRALLAAIDANFAHVRAATGDWPELQAAMRADAERTGGEAGEFLRWLLDGHFTLLGHAEYRGEEIIAPIGIARGLGQELLAAPSRAAAVQHLPHASLLLLKSNRISPVHRAAPLDLVIVPAGDGQSLSLHAGLWTSAALGMPAAHVPLLRQRLADLQARLGFAPTGHAGKALAHALNALPHDLLVSLNATDVEALVLTAMSIEDRPRTKLMLAHDALDRHLFAFVWLPRDELSTDRREAIAAMIGQAADAELLNWSVQLGEAGVALLRYTFDRRGAERDPDAAALDVALDRLVRGWEPSVEAALAAGGDARGAARLALRYAAAFPAAYRAGAGAEEAARDIGRLSRLDAASQVNVRLYREAGDGDTRLRLKIYSLQPLALSDVVPPLENFGFRVVEELFTPLADAKLGAIYRFVVELPAAADAMARAPQLEVAIGAVLAGGAENDRFNALFVSVGLDAAGVVLFRALFRYLRQTGLTYGLATVVDALRRQPAIALAIVDLFRARLGEGGDEQAAQAAIDQGLTQVAAIDEDRILRLLRAVVLAMLRTNFFAPAAAEALAFKFDSAGVPGLPQPLPWREIFVYSPRVEGIHLRAGPVARGGLRWSDRRDDFRTEVLGLMKAQRVKNAVIVPTGAKGGFYPKLLPMPAAGRDAWLAEGTESYRVFIRALLSVTDNLVDGRVVHPQGVRVRDGDDPYFVVAADKGTATFSDVANAIAVERGFWLGDAFASGGSNGYDHKAMGITAKGAWISVQRHFAEAGADVQRDPVTVVGCGDMSGDVFGNGMLLSRSIKLVAAFDHRHIFLDPNPDPAASFSERERLFALPRSSWADYSAALISNGGGVYPRSAKTVPITTEVAAVLGVKPGELEPAELVRAILRAPVGLIWFGGIGTYVKAAGESHAQVGDAANDTLRVDAESLRAQVIGEGANLGLTQAGRIAFALRGGRINTDFIDNSAGVDCSDNEVNIKIGLAADLGSGDFDMTARNALLAAMTDDVAHLVLEDNRLQTLALSIAERGGAGAIPSLVRLIDNFEAGGRLDRAVEGLPANDLLARRAQEGRGLTRPELAVLLATAKLTLQDAIEDHDLARDDGLLPDLLAAFPPAMRETHADAIARHRLRPQIVATKLANRLVNRLGLIHPYELAEEEGVGLGDIAKAFVVAERLYGLGVLWRDVDAAQISEDARLTAFEQIAVETRAQMADLLRSGQLDQPVAAVLAAIGDGVARVDARIDELLRDESRAQAADFAGRLTSVGVPAALVDRIVRLAELDGAVGLAALEEDAHVDVLALARAFTKLGAALGLDWAQGTAMRLSPTDPWERLLIAGLARDLQQMRREWLARDVSNPEARVDAWLQANAARVTQFRALIDRARAVTQPSAAMLAQLAGQARVLLAR